MKIKTLLVALLGSLFLASCFEDDSSLNYKLMNGITYYYKNGMLC